MKEYLNIVKNSIVAATVAGGLGVIYGLIRRRDLLYAANRFIYILGIILITYSIFGNLSFFPKREDKNSTVTTEEIQKQMKEKKLQRSDAPKDYLRAGTVLLIAILLESLRFYVL